MSAYLCSDDTLNALSTFYYMKSGKTDAERKAALEPSSGVPGQEPERLDIEYFSDQIELLNSTITLMIDHSVYYAVFGALFYLDNKKKYILENGNLKVEGCFLRICGHEEWSRLK